MASSALLTLLAGCSDRTTESLFANEGVGTPVVDGVLIVRRPLPAIRVTHTLPANEAWTPARAAERGASVAVTFDSLGALGRVEYEEDLDRPGQYRPSRSSIVRASTRYRLNVRLADGRELGAETTTPELLSVREWLLLDSDLEIRRTLRSFEELGDTVYAAPENRLVYQDGLLEARFDRPAGTAYQVGLSSLDPGSPLVIDADFLSDEDLAELEREVSSPPFDAADAYVRLPWFAIFFEGRYKIRVCSIDRNWYDIVRSVPELGGDQGSFGGLSGDQTDTALFHVRGGIGLFGSGSIDSVGITILPRP